MADGTSLPGISLVLTGDAKGALAALANTDGAVEKTDKKIAGLQRRMTGLGTTTVRAMGGVASSVVSATRALGSMTAVAGKTLTAFGTMTSQIASFGAVAGAAIAGAVATAAQEDPAVARAVASLRATATELAVELSRVVLPAVRAVTQAVADMTAWFRSLDPELKASIGSWAAFAVQATAVLGVTSKLATALGGMAAFIAPILPLAAAVALVAVAAGALYQSLKESAGIDLGDITSAFGELGATIWSASVAPLRVLVSLVNTLREGIRSLAVDFRELFREDINYADLASADPRVRAATQARLNERLAARAPARDWLADLDKKLTEGLTGSDVKRAAAAVGEVAGEGFKHSMRGLEALFKDASHALGLDKLLEQLRGGMPKGTPLSGIPVTPMGQDPFAIRSGLAAPPANVIDVSDRAAREAQVQFLIAMGQRAKKRQEALDAYAEGAFLHAVQLEEARIAFYDAEKARLPSMLQAFDLFADGWHDAFMELGDAARSVIASAAGAIQGMLGKAVGVFEQAAKGFQAGGVFGAIAGAGAALLAQSEQAKRFQAVMDAMTQGLADALGTILEPLITALGGALLAVRPLFELLGGLLTALLGPLEGLAAPLVALAPVFQALAATVQVVVDLLGGLVGGALGLAFRALFEVFKVVGIIVMGIVLGIQTVWNGIADAVNFILGGLGDLFGQDWRVLPKADTDATADALQELTDLTYEAAVAKAKETAASVNLTDAMRSTASQLLNVPEVLRVSALRFAASRAEGLPGEMAPAGAGSVPAPTSGGTTGQLPGEAGTGVTVFIGGQPLRQQLVIERRLNGDRLNGAELEGLFRGGG